MNGRLTQLVLVMATAAVLAEAKAATNEDWPTVPLYPSAPLPPLNQSPSKPAASAPPNAQKSIVVATPTATASSSRTWPAVPLASSSTSAPVIDPPQIATNVADNPG